MGNDLPTSDEAAGAALDAAIDALRQGRPVDRAALLAQHPTLAAALAGLDQLVAPPPPPAPLPTHVGPYRVEREIGTGGFGVVYLAVDPALKRRVAVKVLHAGRLAQPEAVRRFEREARATARLQHPGIVQLFDYSRAGPPYYLVTEYVEGVDPRAWLRDARPTDQQVAELVARVAEAVDAAHRQGVCHRDLKPGNLVVDAEGRPHVLDFGLARLDAWSDSTQTAATSDGHILGSLAYMAPEQASGRSHEADARSDVYSLGVVLYELLAGRPPFQGPAYELPARIVEEEPPPPRQFNPAVPWPLEAICLQAMAKKPAARYPTAAALARDLTAFVRGEPVRAGRGSWLSLVGRVLHRRHRETTLRGWTLLLLLLGVTIFAGCAAANYFEMHGDWVLVLVTKGVQVAVMLGLAKGLRPVKESGGLTAAERQIWSLVPGYYGGFLALLVANWFLAEPIPLAPVLAVLSGMGFATLGATIWGWFYVWGAFFFAAAVAIVLCAPYGMTVLGLAWLVTLAAGSVHLRWTQ